MARVTLKHIAEATGLTVAAVSLALRGRPGVSAGTRERVLTKAKQLGYRRDPALQALTDLRWGREVKHVAPNLALYTVEPKQAWPDFFRRIEASIEEEAEALGWGVEIFSKKEHPNPKRLQQVLRARGVEGILVGFHAVRADWYPQFDFSDFAVVGINSVPASLGMHQVRFNFYQFIEEAWNRLRLAGFRRIGFCHLADEPQAEVDRRRLAFHGWVQTWQTAEDDRVPAFNMRHADPEDLSTWLKQWNPDVVLSSITGLFKLDLDLLQGLPLYSLAADEDMPGIVRQPERTGKMAVRLVDALYRRGERGLSSTPEIILVSGQWQEGSQDPATGTRVGGGGR